MTNIKRTEVYSAKCAETGEYVAVLEVIDLEDQGYSMTLDMDQVMDTILLLCQLRKNPPSARVTGDQTLIEVESIEMMEMPEPN